MTNRTMTRSLVLAFTMVAMANAEELKVAAKVEAILSLSGVSMQVQNASATPPVKDDLFAGTEKFAQGASSVTEITLDPSTMGMLGEDHGPNANLAQKMNLVVIRSYTYDKPGMYRTEDVDAFRKKLEDGSWSCPIRVRSEKGSSDICSRTASDHETNEMVILSANPQKLTFIHMSGKMSLNDLNQMSHGARGLMPSVPIPMPRPAPMPAPAKIKPE